MTKTLQCERFSFLLINPFARLIADSIDEASIVSITVSAEEDESPVRGVFRRDRELETYF
ncbi:MAG: hypothetical protein HFJ51_04375 [Clostridia bacterium]|nr:hypothetical protein [Clostridia bacterium]